MLLLLILPLISCQLQVKFSGYQRAPQDTYSTSRFGLQYLISVEIWGRSCVFSQSCTKLLSCLLQAVFIQDPEVRNFLSDPVGSKKEKRQVIEELKDSANLSQHTLNFLKVLLQDGRLPDASIIFKNFENLYCQRTETEVRSNISHLSLGNVCRKEKQLLLCCQSFH